MNIKVKHDTPQTDNSAESIEELRQRAERAEAELARMQQKAKPEPTTERLDDGIERLREDSMMAHLLDSLEQGKDIGHYGRLVFTIIASRFLPEEEVLEWLGKDPDCTREKALPMLRQLEGRGYSPPRRERILQWQSEQEFPILPDPADPDCGNVYKSLRFPDEVYEHIQDYQMEKAEVDS